MPRFYVTELVNEKVELSEMDSKHAIRVLRMKTGNSVTLLDGKGLMAYGTIVNENQKKTKIKVESAEFYDPPKKLVLAFSPTKSNDRNDWIIEKGTEIGMTDCFPVYAQNSERRKWNNERMHKIAISAIKQSGNPWLPNLHEAQSFTSFMESINFNGLKFIAHCSEGQKTDLKNQINALKDQIIFIGPEGDFTNNELTKAKSLGFEFVSLGENTLRTETACVAALSLMKLG